MGTDRFDTFWVEPSATFVCSECGFSASALPPEEAVTALRAAPGAWRSLLALEVDHRHPEALLTHRPAGGWSALEHAGYVRDVLHALDIRVQRVLREDCPVLPGTHVTPPAGANEQGAAVVLAAQAVSVDQLARTIETTPAPAWHRPGLRAGRRLTALDLVAEAVHAHQHHLGLAEGAIRTARTSFAYSKESAQTQYRR
ncbi:MAG: hypothetical protein KY454_08475 [Actinobacteria bacterium]|nr:hypothetical protein [Actinomycetota bacterium]MBW3651386.1 hypothetical protein [Actinomycetota bacterium]